MPRSKIDAVLTSFKLDGDLRAAILGEFGKNGMAAYLRTLVRKDMETRGRVSLRGVGKPAEQPVVEPQSKAQDTVIADPKATSPRKGRNGRALGPYMADHPSYTPWRTMILKSRQTGVPFDRAWEEFWVFTRDLGPRPPGKVLMRLDQTRPWGPGNCSWDTRRAVNHRRNVVPSYTVGDRTMTLPEWAKVSGVPYPTLYARVAQAGRPIEEAIRTPVAPGPGRRRPRTPAVAR